MAVTDLIKVQVGQAAAWGDAAVATAKLMGVTDASLQVVSSTHHTEAAGRMYPSQMMVNTGLSGEGSISMDLSYEHILFPLDNFFTEAVPALTIYTYTAPTTAITVPNHYTLEIGALDAVADASYDADGVLFTELNIKGEAGGVWTGEFPFICEDITAAVATVLADTTVELIRMSDTTIHFDAWGTAAGTAAATAATLISFDLHVENGRHLKPFAGTIQPPAWGEKQLSGTLTTVVEYNVATKAIADALLAPGLVQRAIQIEANGPAPGSSVATIDFYGTLVNGVKLFEDRDGNITLSLEWEGTYEPTQADWLEIIIDSTLAALP